MCTCDLSNIDIYNLPDCPDTWALISSGNCKGMFQIESNLGRHWAKKLKPNNIDMLAALISIMRPGVLNASQDGKSMTELFCDRRHGAESKTIDPSIEHILKPTYDILIYQEQMLQIAKELCDFSLIELDKLRKGAGKKDARLMNELRGLFVEKAKAKGLVSEDKANEIYDIIEASNRYGFNKCLNPKTLVETQDGPKTLEELQIGDYVDTPEGMSLVKDKIDQGIQQLYEVELESGHKIECTLDHKFMTENGEIKKLSQILIDNDSIMCI